MVDQVGEGVTAFSVGDEVLGASVTPSYAQSALADPAALVARPASVPWEVAGTLAGTGITAWVALDKLKVTEGETLLVHAAAGGVGTFAVQLAVARGARVIGTASEPNHEQLRSLGAEPVTYGEGLVDRVRAIAPQGVDAVLDASGRGEIPASIELAGGPSRVLTLVAFDAADTGIQVHTTVPGEGGPRPCRTSSPSWRRGGCGCRSSAPSPGGGGGRVAGEPVGAPGRQDRAAPGVRAYPPATKSRARPGAEDRTRALRTADLARAHQSRAGR